jgi:hypothetical protein
MKLYLAYSSFNIIATSAPRDQSNNKLHIVLFFVTTANGSIKAFNEHKWNGR